MSPASPRPPAVPVRWLVTALAAWLLLDIALLWPFLGRTDWIAWAAWPLFAVVLVDATWRAMRSVEDRVELRTLLICAAAALALLLIGGEGRLFYANLDWRVRDAVLHDMAVHPWPFAYTARGLPEVLRAPVGMYLLPALAMKAGGQAAGDWALLAQNALLLCIVLALGATLFPDGRRRAVAGAVFVAFSGMDAVGQWLANGRVPDHLEAWAGPLQYSSHVTQLFWVPQHALAGWMGAVGFALWRDGKLPLGVLLALTPLTVLWSPLAALGTLPFAALTGAIALRERRLRAADLLIPALACLLTLPALLYLSAASDTVGAAPMPLRPNVYIAFVALEVAPLLLIAGWSARRRTWGRTSFALVAAMLLLLPLGQIGQSSDFVMRVSIAPLALLALMVADAVGEVKGGRRLIALGVLATGGCTGLHEVRRALTLPPAPPPLCSLYGAWGPGPASHKSTYLAGVARLPRPIRPASVTLVANSDPRRCWAGPWPVPSGVRYEGDGTDGDVSPPPRS